MTSANLLEVARARETTLGVAASPPYSLAFLTAESFDIDKVFERSETITGNRFIQEYIETGIAVTGDAPFEWAMGYADPWLELALMAPFGLPLETSNPTSDSNITDVAAATDEFTAAGAWVEGMVVRASGFTTAGNNGLFVAQAGSGAGTLIVPSSPGLTDEAAPPAGAKLKFVGIEGATGDLAAAADGITSSALDFTDFPLEVGMTIHVGGRLAAINQFATAANYGLATITAIAANKLTLTDLPTGWSVDAGAGKNIRLSVPDVLDPGTSIVSDTIQKRFVGQASHSYYKYLGVACNQLQGTFDPKQVARSTASLIGFTGGVASPALDASPAAPTVGRVMNTSSGIARLVEAGSTLAAGAGFNQLSLSINNNLTPVDELGSAAAVDYDLGDFEVSINARARFKTKTLYEKFLAGTAGSILMPIFRDNQGFTLRAHNLTWTAGKVPTPGRNQQVYANMEGRVVIASGYAKPFTVCRFTEII